MTSILNISHVKKCFLKAKSAEPIPPLGTILGNLGLNTVKFCEEFNIITKDLPSYFLLVTIINIYDNKSYEINLKFPTTGFILNLLKFGYKLKVKIFDRYIEKIIYCVYLKDIIQLAILKFPKLALSKSLIIILGSVKSMNIFIINNLC